MKRQELTQTMLVDLDQQILEGLLHQRCMDVRIRHLRTANLTLSTGLKVYRHGNDGSKRWSRCLNICNVAEDDKVKFAMCTFEGRALTWWNGNVQTLGLANANQIPWSNVKAMMTTEYCPATEIQRMEQELWTLTLKGDDIEAYNNRFHELVLMCPELVSTEKKKIEKYIRGFPEGIKGNVTSSKPATLHDAINMARELIEQGVIRAKVIMES
ncbi:putative reverse transcriptase domain-containing protein [Tanacetum coccineum]